jgi:hypothetical protein
MEEAQKAFKELKNIFIDTPILIYFDPKKPILLVTNALGFAIAGILLQPNGDLTET